jgi:hypothetical protein
VLDAKAVLVTGEREKELSEVKENEGKKEG